jgi:SAM-dependent methyltransferase
MWDERYNQQDYVYGTEPNDFLKQHADYIPKGKVLCLAEGEGRNAVYLASLGYEVTAVDSSQVGLDKAKRLAKEKGVVIDCICADLNEFDLGQDQWQGVVSIFCHLPPPVRHKVHQQISPCLRSGGVLLLEGYTEQQLNYGTGGPPVKEMMMSATELESTYPELNIKLNQEIERNIVEGLFHTGDGHVVQFIAQKP